MAYMECFDLWEKIRPLNPIKTCQQILKMVKNLLAGRPQTLQIIDLLCSP